MATCNYPKFKILIDPESKYATAEQWNPDGDVKGILLEKDKWFSVNDLENMKAVHTEPSLSFLVEENLQAQPIGLVNLKGGLGNQMFQHTTISRYDKLL